MERYLDRNRIDHLRISDTNGFDSQLMTAVLVQFAADRLEECPDLWPEFITKYGERAADLILPKY